VCGVVCGVCVCVCVCVCVRYMCVWCCMCVSFVLVFIKLIDGEVLSHCGFVEKSGIQSTESSQLPLLSIPLASPTISIFHGCGTCVMIKKLVLIHYY